MGAMDADAIIKGAAPRSIADPAATVRALRAGLRDRREVLFAYVFGSFAEGLPYRDVDVGVFVDPAALAGKDAFDFETRLSLDLSRTLGAPIDARLLNGAPVGFQHSVLRGKVLMARDEAALGDFVEQVAEQVMDFAWLGRVYLREVLAG